MQVIIMIGPPGSGKTTKRNEILKKNKNFSLVSRDELRKSFPKNQGLSNEDYENIISSLEKKLIESLLKKRISFIIDNMNIKISFLKDTVKLIYSKTDDVNIHLEIMNVNLKECLENNEKRKNSGGYVPPNVVEAKYHIYKTNFLKYHSCLINTEDTFKKAVINTELPDAIIVDIDGTLAHANDRNIYDLSKVHYDNIDESIKYIVNNEKASVLLVSGRENRSFDTPIDGCKSVLELTEFWLKENSVKYQEIFLRKENDSRKDFVVKNEIFQTEINNRFNILYVLDDRDSVVKFWRDLGLKCLQVAEGDF